MTIERAFAIVPDLFSHFKPARCALAWHGGGETHYLAVGADAPRGEGDPVLAIFEASDFGVYYICTFGQVAREQLSRVFGLDARWSVVDFE